MKIGVTLSHRHLADIGVDLDKALDSLLLLSLTNVRLCCYWNEIEQTPGKYSYDNLDKIVKFCQKNKINIIFALGMKAPRYPEYHLPNWANSKVNLSRLSEIGLNQKYLFNRLSLFLEKTINRYKGYSSIKVWQIENEPLDPSGERWLRISEAFLNSEVRLIKSLDPKRKVATTLWGNELGLRKVYKKVSDEVDLIGFDFYTKCPATFLKFFLRYMGPNDSLNKIKSIIEELKLSGKKVYIAELQAEPWEPNEIFTKKYRPKSFLPADFRKNLDFAKKVGLETVYLWGFEYWLWKLQNGDSEYWDKAREAIKEYNN